MMPLPNEVIVEDRRLSSAADELMELRWHWTLDESNPQRVSQSEYARQVGRDQAVINRDANAWADYAAAQSYDLKGIAPGSPQTPNDYRQLRKLSEDRQTAAKAIAATTGTSVANVASNKRDEVDAVLNTARERAETNQTTLDYEIQKAAEWRTKARKAAQVDQDEHRKAQGLRYIEIEGLVGKAMQSLRKILAVSEGVELGGEETDLLTKSLGDLRSLLGLIDLRIAGETNIDWDAELIKETTR